MTTFSYTLTTNRPTQIGLIALQADESIEGDFRRLIPSHIELFVTRVPSGTEVTSETLASMETHLTAAASLFPAAAQFDAVGYGCTSGTAQIGAPQIAALVHAGTQTRAVSEPVTALIAACSMLNISRLALLSPYIESVSARLRETLAVAGIETPAFGSFAEAEEARVARIDTASVRNAALAVARSCPVQALFLSCTNLRTLDVIDDLEQTLGIPVLSSNQVLAWHLLQSAGVAPPDTAPGRLNRASRRN